MGTHQRTVDALHRRRADPVPDGLIAHCVALRWLEWNGGSLRMSPAGMNIGMNGSVIGWTLAAAAIANSIVFEQTREASLSDALTGLPNTRYMVSHLARELARAERHGSQVAVLVLDLDDFKKINDTYGHHVGDRALREVARVLRETIRPYDVCVRYAGDEFIIVLAGCGPEEAEAKRLELQCAVDTMNFETPEGRPVKVSLSLGAAVYPEDGETYEALLATADGRMYHDKKSRKRPDMRSQLVSLVQPAVDEDFAQEPAVSMAVPPPDFRVN